MGAAVVLPVILTLGTRGILLVIRESDFQSEEYPMARRNTDHWKWKPDSPAAAADRWAGRSPVVGVDTAAGEVVHTGAAASTERLIT